jgi:hypothetical protein
VKHLGADITPEQLPGSVSPLEQMLRWRRSAPPASAQELPFAAAQICGHAGGRRGTQPPLKVWSSCARIDD